MIEQMFDHREVSVPALEAAAGLPAGLAEQGDVVAALRAKVAALESGGPTRLAIPTHPDLVGLVQMRAGGTYTVDSARLALTLMAGASAAGEWTAAVGWPDLGVEAAVELGAAPERMALVPDPGDLWLEVTAALIDVVRLVVLRAPRGVDQRAAGIVEARLRKRSAALVVWGEWPRSEARIGVEESRWMGPERGEGRLVERRARVVVRRGAAPPRHAQMRTGA